jgi:FlgD Ig-like domain
LRRNVTLLVVLCLLVGSAAAFAVAEHLKVERSPVAGPDIDKVFSPVCDCPQQHAKIAFRLRKNDRLTLSLLDGQGDEVRTLVDHVRTTRGRHVFFWNGRDDDGQLLPEASYRPKVELGHADRTIVLPNPIRIDMTPPSIAVLSVRPRIISPDGDARRDVARVRYRASEKAQAVLFVDGVRRVASRIRRPSGQLEWLGSGPNGHGLPPGAYRLAVQAADLAGNLSKRAPAGAVRIRYLALGEQLIAVALGERVRIPVSTDAARVDWKLRRGSSVVDSGVARRTIALQAPAAPGRYVLAAQTGSHTARAVIVVRRRA